jgi:hypothetical protein
MVFDRSAVSQYSDQWLLVMLSQWLAHPNNVQYVIQHGLVDQPSYWEIFNLWQIEFDEAMHFFKQVCSLLCCSAVGTHLLLQLSLVKTAPVQEIPSEPLFDCLRTFVQNGGKEELQTPDYYQICSICENVVVLCRVIFAENEDEVICWDCSKSRPRGIKKQIEVYYTKNHYEHWNDAWIW